MIGELIRTHSAEILRDWTAAAKQATSAKDLTSSAGQQALIERHLSKRLREGFSLNEILTEFAVLGRGVASYLQAEDIGDRPSVADLASSYGELYQTSTAVTRIFNEHLLEDAQTMKRYARLLGRLAAESLDFHYASVPLLERLHEVLDLIPPTQQDQGEPMNNPNLRAAVATIAGELSALSSLPAGTIPPSSILALQASWTRLVGLLALTPEDELRTCPKCQQTIMRAATRCGYCWEKLVPTTTHEA